MLLQMSHYVCLYVFEPVCLFTSVFATMSSEPEVGSGLADAVLSMTARTSVVSIFVGS